MDEEALLRTTTRRRTERLGSIRNLLCDSESLRSSVRGFSSTSSISSISLCESTAGVDET